MFTLINGFTKERMIEAIRQGNNGSKAINPITGACVYLASDGNKCAVGCFIPDGHKAQCEGEVSATFLVKKYPELKTLFPLPREGMDALQCIHDIYIRLPNGPDVRETIIEWINANVI